MPDYEVISTFLDNEPFDPGALADALADERGRTLLIDLLTLRRLTQPEEGMVFVPLPSSRPARTVLRMGIAAALALALAGGYRYGQRSAPPAADVPLPTRVIQVPATWQAVPSGGVR